MEPNSNRQKEMILESAMTTRDIISKLTGELNKGITTEPQVVYLLVGIRKLIERNDESEYPNLKFHCDWALHSRLDRAGARAILRKFDAAHVFLKDNKVELGDLPADLRTEIDRISKMQSFEKELTQFLDDYGLPPLSQNRVDGWSQFLHSMRGWLKTFRSKCLRELTPIPSTSPVL
jgi:hypothetical protein